jgi:hypothetical protein
MRTSHTLFELSCQAWPCQRHTERCVGLSGPAPLCPRRRGGRDAIAVELGRYPVSLRFVVLVSGGALKGVFRSIHRQIPTSVLLRRVNGVERHCNILRVHSKEATDRDDEGGYLAAISDQDVDDLTDLAIGRVVEILLVVVRDCCRGRRNAAEDVSVRCRNPRGCALLCESACADCRCDRRTNGQFFETCRCSI